MNRLQSITAISGIRAFDSFEWVGAPAKKYNLIYGWNGAGKSTIARILSFFEHRRVHLDGFDDLKFKLKTERAVVTERDVASARLNVKVFNADFVRTNVLFDASEANPIVIVGKKSIVLDKEIRDLEKSLADLVAERDKLGKQRRNHRDPNNILKECGKTVVHEFLETSFAKHQYYGRSYNRSRVKKLIDDGTVTAENADSLLLEEPDRTRIREQLQARHQEIAFRSPNLERLEQLFEEGNRLLRRVIAVAALERLESDDEVRSWVKEGYRLHTERGATKCYFCTNAIAPTVLAEYAGYFTDEVTKTEEAIGRISDELKKLEEALRGQQYPDSGQFLTSLAAKYMELRNEIKLHSIHVLEACETLRKRLETRRGRVHVPGSEGEEVPFPEKQFSALKAGFRAIDELCSEHNELLKMGKEKLEKEARRLELHVVAHFLLKDDYFKIKAELDAIDKEIAALEKEIEEVNNKLQEKRSALEDMSMAVDEINNLIAEFLGPGEIELTAVPSGPKLWRYRITRRGTPASYLSEGEKSVVALAYFLVKLREKDFDLEQTIIVLDDPVDSQDSIFLFRTYGLLKRLLGKAGQLFILTHNYELFNLVRDWLCSDKFKEDSSLYWIEKKRTADKRTVIVQDMPALLRDYKSEYQYLFYRLYAHQKKADNLEEPLVPNVARKVLEYFASFKWSCRSSEQLSSIVQSRFVTSENPRRRAVGDAVLKFVNEYSHGRDFGRPVTSAVAEADAICNDVLEFIRMNDRVHYQALETICTKMIQ